MGSADFIFLSFWVDVSSDFLAEKIKNSSFYVCLKKVDIWPIVHQMRQRMEFHFKSLSYIANNLL